MVLQVAVRRWCPARIFVMNMLVHRDLSSLPRFRHAVVTIGTFDGVHAGHRKIIEQLKEEAAQINGETIIITFHPHPRKVVREGQLAVPILTTLPEKIFLVRSLGIDHLVVIPFDEAFANQTAEAYIRNFLVEKFHPHTIIIGYDHKFGKGRQGDYHLLEQYGETLHFSVKEIPEHVLNEIAISSTRIREALLRSNIDIANQCLDYPFFFEALVVKGDQRGRTIGYPTANLEIEDKEKIIPGNGVYAVEVSVFNDPASAINGQLPNGTANSGILQGMMNIGVRPTVDGTRRTIEVNLFDFNEDIYGKTLRVSVRYFLRGEIKFSGLDALKAQLANDKEAALALLNKNR